VWSCGTERRKQQHNMNHESRSLRKNEAEEDKRRDGWTRCNKISSNSNSMLTSLRTELNGEGELVWLTSLQRDIQHERERERERERDGYTACRKRGQHMN